jgi:hypothetical protein
MAAIGALVVLGACLTWILSNRNQHDQRDTSALNAGESAKAEVPEIEVSEAGPLAFDAAAPVQREALADAGAVVTFDVGFSGDGGWPLGALEFAAEADPDPTLSRYLETEVHRLVDTMLDVRRYEVHSIMCRGPACQVLTRDHTPDPIPATGPHTYNLITPILRGLSSSDIRDPATGNDIKPKLELVRGTRGSPAGVEFLVVFATP